MRVSILISGLLFAAACGSDSTPTPPASHNKTWDVFTLPTSFSPFSTAAARGDTVRFTIATSSDGHDVTFNATVGAPANINVSFGGVFTRVFTSAGTFRYECKVHPGMIGEVVVQ